MLISFRQSIGLCLSMFLLAGCEQKSAPGSQPINNASTESQEKNQLPINVVIKKGSATTAEEPIDDLATGIAPGVVGPGIDPGVGVAGPVGIGPDIPFFPPPPFLPPPVLLPPPPFIGDDEDSCIVPFCGNGIREDDEDCDDGNDSNSDDCDIYCRRPICGNSIVEGIEECDDPDNVNCIECRLPLCGNNRIDAGETCDPPNQTTCNYNCVLSLCGNSIVELGEQCDDGNQAPGDGCTECLLSCTPPQGNVIQPTRTFKKGK